ncbi:hypothetical protein [Ureibacillus acetophenoni]|uniref:Uncharacterized protein n=1 Tax=Ureibacillus acetophenoni TaxID=614649 RepID=A0A285UID9_9BACL|nr:hypothetical protein [Ureibacillus acetophenoni]SOC41457.1 hypothetical protein SAMN05877842_11068 [Ureibacillus acetophenoni]
MEQLNNLEKYYYFKLKEILESNGTTFFKNLTSQFLFNDIEETYSGKSAVADVMERVVQTIISNNTDWEIFSHPASSDSSFLTPKAVIHIDCKSTLDTDQDAIGHKVDLGKNQTSYASIDPIDYLGTPFKSNLPTVYDHQLYGELYTLTYIVKLVYNLDSGIDSLRNFELYLCSIPNGLMRDELGLDFVQAGRTMIRPFFTTLDNVEYTNLYNTLNSTEKAIFDQSYQQDSNNNYLLHDWLLFNANSLDETKKEVKKQLTKVYKDNRINQQREKLRINFNDMQIDNDNEYKWNRYELLSLK